MRDLSDRFDELEEMYERDVASNQPDKPGLMLRMARAEQWIKWVSVIIGAVFVALVGLLFRGGGK